MLEKGLKARLRHIGLQRPIVYCYGFCWSAEAYLFICFTDVGRHIHIHIATSFLTRPVHFQKIV